MFKSLLKSVVIKVLTVEARCTLVRRRPFIIAVTGSVGKTSTKDAIATILAAAESPGAVRASTKSFNSEIGIPLTILGLANAWGNSLGWAVNLLRGLFVALGAGAYAKYLVLEVGADHPGDIKRVTEWLRPDIAVVTRLPDTPVHVENFPSPEAVRREKAYLVERLNENGVFVGNSDDPEVVALRTKTKARFLSYGFGEDAVVRATHAQVLFEETPDGKRVPRGMTFRVDRDGSSFPVRLCGTIGPPVVHAALAALAVGVARGMNMFTLVEALETLKGPPGRMRILEGANGSTIIDDSYNSSPVAVHSALAVLRELDARGRKIAILGDMLELGEHSEREHRAVGNEAGAFLSMLLTVGKRARWIAEAATSAGMATERVVSFDSSDEAGKWLRERLLPGDVIFAKGSQGSGENRIRIERAVRLLLADPLRAPELLVRQEKEWERRY